ncbi:type II secretion system protein GspM [endosymbiont of Ridgeia piscesae]|jgi:hypothetical protein|uniref:General secretion pathway protein M n=1 Tax=endosymbiont of Ridgeia piscesae TaxID=54398 RepID=A0A0T5YY32_9GAMM|nr:type II secretion system protein GspM [endosymbiont of Ridgeia piscesae]KRT55556.1 Type II secretion system (T2SS), protein M subtype b [endosymbiont of Ridgeia piscesae]KRT57380.1 general secretion pathway protein M [endosymbiont of Ridgeia piscesae]
MKLGVSPSLRKLAAQLLLLLLVVGGTAALLIPYLTIKQSYDDEISSVRKRIEIYQRSVAVAEALQQQYQQLEMANRRDKRYLKAQSESLGGAELQGILTRVVRSSRGKLLSTRVLPIEQDGSFGRVSIRVSMKGAMESIFGVLYALESGEPYLLISDLQLQGKRTSRRHGAAGRNQWARAGTELACTFVLSGYIRG